MLNEMIFACKKPSMQRDVGEKRKTKRKKKDYSIMCVITEVIKASYSA